MSPDESEDLLAIKIAVHPSRLPFEVLTGLDLAVMCTIDDAVERMVAHDDRAIVVKACPSINGGRLFVAPVEKGIF